MVKVLGFVHHNVSLLAIVKVAIALDVNGALNIQTKQVQNMKIDIVKRKKTYVSLGQ